MIIIKECVTGVDLYIFHFMNRETVTQLAGFKTEIGLEFRLGRNVLLSM